MKTSVVWFGCKNKDWPIYQETSIFIGDPSIVKPSVSDLTSKIEVHALCDARIFVIDTQFLNSAFFDTLKTHLNWFKPLIWILLDSSSFLFDQMPIYFRTFNILKLTSATDLTAVQQAIDNAWILIREQEQNDIFDNLLSEKNQNLIKAQIQVKKEIQLALDNKQTTRKKLEIIAEWGYLLRQSLWIIHRSENLLEVEELLLDLLKTPFHLSNITIIVNGAQSEKISQDQTSLKLTLQSQHADIATLWVSKIDDSLFSTEEKDFFNRLAEALELAISRIKVVEDLSELEQEWQRTFDAISDPVVLTSDQFNIIQTNSAAKNWLATNQTDGNQTCYSAFFNRSTPCQECKRNQKFELVCQKTPSIYEVSSHLIHKFNNTSFPIYIHLYRNVTHIKQMEKSLVEQESQLALGTLSSSIAHELNNPVGGILTLSQLLKMDFETSSKEHEVFSLIELQAIECKKAIENLLEFTHAQTSDFNSQPNSQCEIGNIIHQGFALYKSIHETQTQNQVQIVKLNEPIYLQAKTKVLIDLFYLLFVTLHRIPNENWLVTVQKNSTGFQILFETKSKNSIDPNFISQTPLEQYFRSLRFNLIINNSVLEILYSAT